MTPLNDRPRLRDAGLHPALSSGASLAGLRAQIDHIDHQLVALLCERLDVSARIGHYKAAMGVALLDLERERELVERATAAVEPSHRDAIRHLIVHILAESKRTMAAETVGPRAPKPDDPAPGASSRFTFDEVGESSNAEAPFG